MSEFETAESTLRQIEPGYLERVRDAAGKLGVRGAGPDLVRDSIRGVEELVHIDADVPTYASQRGGKTVKTLIKRSIQWYVRYLAVQVNAFGQAMVGLGTAIADRLDELEASDQRLRQRVDELSRRIESLETGDPQKPA